MSLLIIDIRTTEPVRRDPVTGDVVLPARVWEAGETIRATVRAMGTLPPYDSYAAWGSEPFHIRVEVLDTSSETGVRAALKAVMAQYPGLFPGEPSLTYRGD